MTKKFTAAILLAMSLVSATAASAQTVRDWYRYQYGNGPCVTDEGYGRFTSCDSSGQ